MPFDQLNNSAKVNRRPMIITKDPTTRKRSERRLLKAEPCRQCINFFGDPKEVQKYCRHRFTAPRARTPPGFWEVGWGSPDNSRPKKKLKTSNYEKQDNQENSPKPRDTTTEAKGGLEPESSTLALLSPVNAYYSPIKPRKDVRKIKLPVGEKKADNVGEL